MGVALRRRRDDAFRFLRFRRSRTLLNSINFRRLTYHSSLGSGRVRCTEIMSLTYWLNAFFCQPSSISFFTEGSGLSILTARPMAPGPSGLSLGRGSTPSAAFCADSRFGAVLWTKIELG